MSPPPVIRLHPDDGVVIARATLLPGTTVAEGVAAIGRIPAGHKVAVQPLAVGDAIRRYGQIIGFATAPIAPGEHVHVHNCGMGDFAKDYAYGVDAKPTAYIDPPATFQGIRRPDGRVATRNYIGILTSVNCSAHVASVVADAFKRNPFTGADPLADFANVDGVVALTHKTGCGMTGGEPLALLRRTLGGFARHVNFSAVIVMGLGCEVNQIGGLMEEQRLAGRLRTMDIQDMGGSRKTVAAGIDFVREALQDANKVHRETVPVSELTVALQCGGSDGYSGVSANPALGAASDLIVRNGGSVILSETPETYGAEHLLTRRAVSRGGRREAGRPDALVGGVRAARGGGDERQPLAGQQGRRPDHDSGKVAGRDGEVRQHQPGGRAALRRAGDQEGASTSWTRPGYDPVAATGQVAGGANFGVLHHRARQRVRLQAGAVDQAGDQHTDVHAHGRRHGRELRHDPRRRRDGAASRPADFRPHPARGLRRADQERVVRFRRRRIRALGARRHDVMPPAIARSPSPR